eukprot:604219-Rhodomonas_salina.1
MFKTLKVICSPTSATRSRTESLYATVATTVPVGVPSTSLTNGTLVPQMVPGCRKYSKILIRLHNNGINAATAAPAATCGTGVHFDDHAENRDRDQQIGPFFFDFGPRPGHA